MKNYTNFIFVFVISFILYSYFFKNNAEADARTSYEQLQRGEAVFIDVREESEVMQGMVRGSLWFPLSQLQSSPVDQIRKIKVLAQDKSIYVYCRSGNRSGIASNILKEKGLNAINLGGYKNIISENIPSQPGPTP